jgi:hypothetical protein
MFLAFFLSCKANARVKLAFLDGARLIVLFYVFLFVLCYVLFVCDRVLPPGDNPIAVNIYNNYNNNNNNNFRVVPRRTKHKNTHHSSKLNTNNFNSVLYFNTFKPYT